ncbi:FKBP-type peptidyl-prolyl cis-trans isomerase [Parvicella tangerina]|uniref:Peptidyl-prolyl cis-trans isomerase n=1 Tax=Parvicella tangerina TaxID=2829795 RepID=A0A916JPI4_9FLAO|nr:peptidylprolyl isomerase [Parvicella tangerina]CAG5085067.1 FKBP-type peptidyl-prolyl cis-trans isomerase SlyD [Parvicella tangerina]
MKISKDRVAQIHYTLTNTSGELLDTSLQREPLLYLHGYGSLIQGLENALEDKATGDKINVEVSSENAYGEYHDQLVQVVPKSGFQSEGDEELAEGIQVQVETNNGLTIGLVTKIEGEDVTLDLNHPLAGMDLKFEVEILDVREATAEEIEHGHAHGAGGHQH